MMKISVPQGTTELSHVGVPYPIAPDSTITVPEEVAPFFLRLEGFKEVAIETANPARTRNRATNEKED